MKRTLQGKYITSSTAGESVQAFVPTPLPPDPPIDWTPQFRSGVAGDWAVKQCFDPASGHVTVSLHVHPQRGCAVFHD